LNRRGVALVEILIAAGLVAVAATSFFSLVKTAGQSLKVCQQRQQALYAARSQMEQLFNKPSSEEAAVLKTEIGWDSRRKPLILYSLRSKY